MRMLASLFAMMFALAACAQEENPSPAAEPLYKEGVHYKALLEPVRTITPGKIEVTEAFAYTCPHCYHFEPLLHAWEAKLPDDVALVRLPVIWQPAMAHYSRIMYTGQALGISEAVDKRVFDVLHRQKKNLDSEADAAAVFAELGVDSEKFSKTFKSFGVNNQVQQASARTRSMQITGTPQLVVDGRYSVSANKDVGGHEGMLKVANFLIEKIRAERN